MPFRILLALFLVLAAHPALSHEFWIEARDYQVQPGGRIEAGIYNGQNFNGVELAWFEGRIAEAHWAASATTGGFTSRTGDRPALKLTAPAAGLLRLIYQSTPSTLTYDDWEKFSSFATGKGNGWAIARHDARGLSRTGVRESYTRFCKALVAIGDGAGHDAFSGMEAELVALSNPYADPAAAGLRVEFRYQGTPRPSARIDIFEKAATGKVTKTHVVTDDTGQALVPLTPGARYLLDAVILREASADTHSWESLWASLTFRAPQ